VATAISRRRALLDPGTRGRVVTVKRAVAFGCLAAFAAAFGATRASHPSHAKHALTRLDPPGAFVRQLQDDQLRGGVVAAPEAPPEAQTAVS
jgi:hypothetical protein